MKLRTKILVFSVVCFLVVAMSPIAKADCVATTVSHVNTVNPVLDGQPAVPATHWAAGMVAGPANINQEGRAERVTDLIIVDDGLPPTCFSVNTDVIKVTYNAPITVPNPPTYPAVPGTLELYNFDVIDSNGDNGLRITANTTTTLGPFGDLSEINISVTQLGTAGNPFAGLVGSALRFKNIRVDASGFTAPAVAYATVSTTFGSYSHVPAILAVGTVQTTIKPYPAISLFDGNGEQSEGGPLFAQGEVNWSENFPNAFRVACTTQIPASSPYCTGVLNDIPTSDTSLVWSVSNIPNGVTVSFPASLTNAASTLTYTARGGAQSCAGSTSTSTCDVIYDTTLNNPATIDSIAVQTAATASNGGAATNPKIGVQIADPSGWGNVDVAVNFGPSTVCQTTYVSDDCDGTPLTNLPLSAGRIPRYVDSVAASTTIGGDLFGGGGSTRLIASGEWFEVNPIRTVLLYDYVTDVSGFGTGISVANTGQDCTVPGSPTITNCAFLSDFAPGNPSIVPVPTRFHAGLLHFFVFPNGAAPFVVDSPSFVGDAGCLPVVNCGLDGAGNLQPGNVMAVGLSAILTAGGQGALIGNFDGYIIVVAEFNYGHGTAVSFSATSAMYGYPALILGKQSRIGKSFTHAEQLDN